MTSIRDFCFLVLAMFLLNMAAADDRPAGLPEDAKLWPELKLSLGTAYRSPNAVYFVLGTDPPQAITFARLANPMRRAYCLGDPNRKPLTLKPEPKQWSLRLAALTADQQPVVVLELHGTPQLASSPTRITANDNGELTLPAHLAVTHGDKLRYEPQPHKNTVGYWTNRDDWAEWLVEIPSPGAYEVDLLQGCGPKHGGSQVNIVFLPKDVSPPTDKRDKHVLPYTVFETGHFQNFQRRPAGTVNIRRSGTYRVQLRTTKIANKAVMDVREVRIRPGTKLKTVDPR